MKKLIAILLCAVLCLAVFASCGKESEKSDKSETKSESSSVPVKAPDSAESLVAQLAICANTKDAESLLKLFVPDDATLEEAERFVSMFPEEDTTFSLDNLEYNEDETAAAMTVKLDPAVSGQDTLTIPVVIIDGVWYLTSGR